MIKTTHSNRQYHIFVSENGRVFEFDNSIDELLDDDNTSEVIFSLWEIIDLVLDLKTNESLCFKPNRDSDNGNGIITRTN